MLEERSNIELYLLGCKKLSIPSQDTFILSDLHSAKSMGAVLQNIYALGRQAQVISSFKGPILGVKYNVSIAEQQRRIKKKEQERVQQMERMRAVSETQLVRRKELETLKREEIIKDMETNDIRRLHRQYSRGSISSETFHKLAYASDAKFKELRNSDVDLVSNSDVKFGVDIEIHERKKKSYSLKREEQAMDWVEAITEQQVDDFYEDLKSGIVLCKLLNSIYPNVVKKIGTKDIPLVHRDNIQQYLNGCKRIGLNPSQSFNVSDLYEKKDLDAVINNIFALGRKAEFAPGFKGKALKVDGSMVSPFKPPEDNKITCRCHIM